MVPQEQGAPEAAAWGAPGSRHPACGTCSRSRRQPAGPLRRAAPGGGWRRSRARGSSSTHKHAAETRARCAPLATPNLPAVVAGTPPGGRSPPAGRERSAPGEPALCSSHPAHPPGAETGGRRARNPHRQGHGSPSGAASCRHAGPAPSRPSPQSLPRRQPRTRSCLPPPRAAAPPGPGSGTRGDRPLSRPAAAEIRRAAGRGGARRPGRPWGHPDATAAGKVTPRPPRGARTAGRGTRVPQAPTPGEGPSAAAAGGGHTSPGAHPHPRGHDGTAPARGGGAQARERGESGRRGSKAAGGGPDTNGAG